VIRVANAPCSYGAFEFTVGVLPNVPEAEAVLAAISSAGYVGTEQGPPGYLGDGERLRERLARHGLELAGAFVPIRFSEPEHWDEGFAALAMTLDLFAAGDGAADLVRERGFEPTFHHHVGTHVEAPWEIERLADLTDVGLVLDTGHILLGGGDPVGGLRAWGERVNHVHAKDVRLDVLHGVIADRSDMPEAWRRGIFCELGAGDVELDSFFAALRERGYDGWVVVEQDRIPRDDEYLSESADAQARNRAWLRERAGI
jgi:inosose dehydratase